MAISKPQFLTILLVVVTVSSTAISTVEGGSGGQFVYGRTKVENVKRDKAVQDLGRFAVDEYNKQSKEAEKAYASAGLPVRPRTLVFKEVFEAEREVTSKRIESINFRLKLMVSEGKYATQCASYVIVKPWERSKIMSGFEILVQE